MLAKPLEDRYPSRVLRAEHGVRQARWARRDERLLLVCARRAVITLTIPSWRNDSNGDQAAMQRMRLLRDASIAPLMNTGEVHEYTCCAASPLRDERNISNNPAVSGGLAGGTGI